VWRVVDRSRRRGVQSLRARVLAAAAAAAAAEAHSLGPRTRNEPWVCSRKELRVCPRAVLTRGFETSCQDREIVTGMPNGNL
jgi:hypothetical protein